jgi:hypothetical protein
MCRHAIIWLVILLSTLNIEGKTRHAIVADISTHQPLPSASIFDGHGTLIGVCNLKGKTPAISEASYPITVRYLGYKERTYTNECPDTIFLRENPADLPEVLVESRQHKVLHMLAYMREYSSLTTYTDTIFLFREKMVDFMLNPNNQSKFRGWSTPRAIKAKSYYHFTNQEGLDSVSNVCNHQFSWADWIGVTPTTAIPAALSDVECATDTVRGKYSPTEVWVKNGNRLMIDIDVLANTASRKWVPNLSTFFNENVDFDRFKISFSYDDVVDRYISPINLTGYSYNIESNGRGRDMILFHRRETPYSVSTYAEVYFIDKEYITVKEARAWEGNRFENDSIEIYKPAELDELSPSILALIDRVDNINIDKVRLGLPLDYNLVGCKGVNHNFQFGYRFLNMLKNLTGINQIRSDRKAKKKWHNFIRQQALKNNEKAAKEARSEEEEIRSKK